MLMQSYMDSQASALSLRSGRDPLWGGAGAPRPEAAWEKQLIPPPSATPVSRVPE